MLITSNTLIAAPSYTIEPIGSLGTTSTSATDINDHGQIVGTSIGANVTNNIHW